MSASNQTTNYELPIFVGTDIPTWLTDFNGAMLKLDTALHNLKLKNDTEDEDISDLEGAVSDINQAISGMSDDITDLQSAVAGITTKNVITAGMSDNLTLSVTGDTVVPLAIAKTQLGNKLSVANNRIYIGAGISKILVSAQVYVNRSQGNDHGAFNIQLRKNGSQIADSTNSGMANIGNVSRNITPILINVSEGDYIDLVYYGYASDVIRSETGTYVTIEAVD